MPYQPFWKIAKMALFYPIMKIKKILGQMYSFDVVNNSPLWFFFHKVPLAPSMCLFKWIKVDKLDDLKIGSRDFKNSFYFGIVWFPSIPGMCQKLCLVKRPFRSRPRQCALSVEVSICSKNLIFDRMENKTEIY